MLNLFDYLTELDKKRIENYVKCYGTEKYIGNERYLKDWCDSNKKLFRLLGGNLIYSTQINVEKDENVVNKEMQSFVSDHEFIEMFEELYSNYVTEPAYNVESGIWTAIPSEHKWERILYFPTLIENKVEEKYEVLKEDPNTGEVKVLKIMPGMKAIKALKRIIDFLEPDNLILQNGFEDFRLEHSKILNDKRIKGKLCLSIHPLDFMTMSDNASNWSSCMSWVAAGCYHTGTVEMMNSNLVICAYLESDKPYNFSPSYSHNDSEEWTWNNKKWRQLFYCNKDIIVGGKAYPYRNDSITFFVLNWLRDLAKQNWNTTYTYGIEKYRDMIHINTLHKMNNNRMWARGFNPIKHNIIFDTKAMYNDMFNDKKTPYWCIRNKVKKNIMLNLSGKVCCAQCGKYDVVDQIDYDYIGDYGDDDGANVSEEDQYDYNYQYVGSKRLLCKHCYNDNYCETCSHEGRALPVIKMNISRLTSSTFSVDPEEHKIKYSAKNVKKKICKNCFLTKMAYCPTCGELFNLDEYRYRAYNEVIFGLYHGEEDLEGLTVHKDIFALDGRRDEDYIPDKIMTMYECPACCANKLQHECKKITIPTNVEVAKNPDEYDKDDLYYFKSIYIYNKLVNEKDYAKYHYKNLLHPTEKDFYEILNEQARND